MAHTCKGNMTGRAAATHRAEEKNAILEIGQRVDLDGIRARLKQKETEAIARCIKMEGKLSFYAWYASVDGAVSERVEKIEDRIQELETEARYTVVETLLGKEGAPVLAILDAAELVK